MAVEGLVERVTEGMDRETGEQCLWQICRTLNTVLTKKVANLFRALLGTLK